MSLLEDAKALMVHRGPTCDLATLKAEHPDYADEIEELIEAVRSKTVYGSKAAVVLKARFGVSLVGQTVRRHANRVCSCP